MIHTTLRSWCVRKAKMEVADVAVGHDAALANSVPSVGFGSVSAAHSIFMSVRFCDILSSTTPIVNISLSLNWHLNERNVNHHQFSLQQRIFGGLNGGIE